MRARALDALDIEEWRTAEAMRVSKPTAREVLTVLFDYGLIQKDESGKANKYRKASEKKE
jgi:Fe2+ or Zn2+ uptake regulation protein